MNARDTEDDFTDFSERREATRDREISLGTTTVLGIFFALALVCSAFFGFGYTLGRKSTQPTVAAADVSSTSDYFKSFKPAPGNPAGGGTAPAKSAASAFAATPPPASVVVPSDGDAVKPVIAKKAAYDPDAEIVTTTTPTPPAPKAAPVVRQAPAAAAPVAAGGALVQVSAFRRQEDADMVASALRKKGYTVFIRTEPQDSYLHVQLGPYGSKKEAEAMKERLSADGFNAMVK